MVIGGYKFKPKPNITDIFNVQNGIPLREIPWGHNRLSLSDSYDQATLQFTYFGNWNIWRYTKPKSDISERLCPLCNAVEDEIHFLVNCKVYEAERLRFLRKIMTKIRNFNELDDVEKLILLMSSEDNQIVTWTGKFICKSFNIRSRFYLNCGGT